MKNEEIQKLFYFPFCNKEEIDRIFNIQNGADYLLKLRADQIADNTRLLRVIRSRVILNEKNWSLERYFTTDHFDYFLNSVSPEHQDSLRSVTYGNIFSSDPHGRIFPSDYGPIITISDSYYYFFYFMNLAIMNLGKQVPQHVRINALRIGIRIMMNKEAMDFDLDPRGIIPMEIHKKIASGIPYKMLFIAGHEFSHYLLGHLDTNNVSIKPLIFNVNRNINDGNNLTHKVYNKSQKQELETDLAAINLPELPKDTKKIIMESALIWCCYIDIFEGAMDIIAPRNPYRYETHPSPHSRFENILNNAFHGDPNEIDKYRSYHKSLQRWKDFLAEDISIGIENYEIYGSVYLDKPNTKWRGKQLIDRKDY